jgi:hypothetical protein
MSRLDSCWRFNRWWAMFEASARRGLVDICWLSIVAMIGGALPIEQRAGAPNWNRVRPPQQFPVVAGTEYGVEFWFAIVVVVVVVVGGGGGGVVVFQCIDLVE